MAKDDPWLTRPGARFTCHGDGLCCTDVHRLGPISAREAHELAKSHPGTTTRLRGQRLLRLSDAHRPGACVFLKADGRCEVHAEPVRPATCRRFPFLLARTPHGLRLGTDHRCPCRTMGERSPLDAAEIRSAVADRRGRARPDRWIEGRIALTRRTRVGFDRYVEVERDLLASLELVDGTRRVEDALNITPFPPTDVGPWEHIGIALAAESRPSRWGEAFRLFGKTLAWLHAPRDERPLALKFPPRIWSESFDRAERRSAFEPGAADVIVERMFADFVADAIWSLEWTSVCDLTQLRADLCSRVAVARALVAAFVVGGARPDRAAAEAIAVVEVVGVSPDWTAVVCRMPS